MAAPAAFDLAGRVALVTGASSGIGREIARALSEAGASVVLLARRARELEEARAEVEAEGGRAATLAADLADRASLRAAAARARDFFGDPDILVNAAGVNLRGPMLEIGDAAWDTTLAVNLSAPFFLAQALAPAMVRRRWGRIINIASLQSLRAFPMCAPYGASKGGVMQLTRAQAEALSKDGVTANAIAPGLLPHRAHRARGERPGALGEDGAVHLREAQRRAARPARHRGLPREPRLRLRDRPDDLRRRRLLGRVNP